MNESYEGARRICEIVRDMRTMWIMSLLDPDGFYAEVIWRKPGLADAETTRREDWAVVDLTPTA